MLELISVHVPKTGGTSLRDLLKRKYGRRLGQRYGIAKRPVWRWAALWGRRVAWDIGTLPGPRALHGHFPASRYHRPGLEMIVFVRDPLAQRISTWHYHRRRYEEIGVIANQEAKNALAMDLADFVAVKEPIFEFYLDVPLDQFTFIGSMDDFDADVARLADHLGVPHKAVRANVNPKGSKYAPDPEVVSRFEASNPRENDIYHAALERRRQLIGG